MSKLLLVQFDLHQRLYHNALDGFTDNETNQRPHGNPNMNHVKYLTGHLLNSQYGLAMIAGLEPEVKWNDFFAVMGQSEAKDNISYPSIEEIKWEWDALYKPTRKGLSELSDDDLENPHQSLSGMSQIPAENFGRLLTIIKPTTSGRLAF